MQTELERITALEVEVRLMREDVEDLEKSMRWLSRLVFLTLSAIVANAFLLVSGVHL